MNKTLNRNGQSEQRTTIKNETMTWKYDKYFLLASLFILSGLYFYLFGNYVFFYQENLTLFVFSGDYLSQFTSKPGGLLEYFGHFISQGYFSNLYGSFIQSAIFISIAVIFLKINNKLSADRSVSLILVAVVSCILILLQANFNYLTHNNLGFILAGSYFLISISSDKKVCRFLVLVFFPLFFYLTGAYAWIFLGMFTFYNVLKKKAAYAAILLIIAAISLLLFKRIIFLQPWSDLLYYPLPVKDYFNNPIILWLVFLFFVFYPVFLNLINIVKTRNNHTRVVSNYSVLFILALTIFLLARGYSQDTSNVFKLEKMFFARDWNGVIKYQETCQSRNLVAQYYYNTALSENGILCDRMFFAPQDYGTQSIMIPWNSQISINRLFRGVYFYYSIGLINEAHRWAFESMVTQGYRPENIKLLIKTDLINGHYKVAEKYINVLKKTLHYGNWAKKYEAMLINPELIESDPELGEKLKLKPQGDFLIRIRNPEKNIVSLLQSNPGNKKALEYKLACLMLEKDIEGTVNDINSLTKMGYSKIPRHIEEAALMFNAKVGSLTELNGLKISDETKSRFAKYESTMILLDRNNPLAGSGIQKELKNTYWYYLDVKKPYR